MPSGTGEAVVEATHEREERVVRMREMGMTFAQIARELDFADHTGALRAWERGIRRLYPHPRPELEKRRVLAELDAQLVRLHLTLQRGTFIVVNQQGIVRGPTGEPMEDVGAKLQVEDRIIKNVERRCRILGLDAPTKARVDVVDAAQLLEAVLEAERKAEELERLGGGVIDVDAVDDGG